MKVLLITAALLFAGFAVGPTAVATCGGAGECLMVCDAAQLICVAAISLADVTCTRFFGGAQCTVSSRSGVYASNGIAPPPPESSIRAASNGAYSGSSTDSQFGAETDSEEGHIQAGCDYRPPDEHCQDVRSSPGFTHLCALCSAIWGSATVATHATASLLTDIASVATAEDQSAHSAADCDENAWGNCPL